MAEMQSLVNCYLYYLRLNMKPYHMTNSIKYEVPKFLDNSDSICYKHATTLGHRWK